MTEKTASPATLLARLGKGVASIGRQISKGGVRDVGAAVGKHLGWARGGAEAAKRLGHTVTPTRALTNIGRTRVRGRMINRAIGFGAAGAGGSALMDKAQGRDVNWGRAAASGLVGAGLGAVAGTTVGKRTIRRLTSPQRTQTLSTGQALKSIVSPKGIVENVKNMPLLEKGFLGMTVYDTAKGMTDPERAGQRGRNLGSGLGEAAAILGTSRWRGMRRLMGRTGLRGAAGGGLGTVARGLGAYTGGTMLGGHIGSRFDPKKPHIRTEAPYG